LREDLKQYKQEYYSIGHIICPVLNNEKVYFNNYGFNHLIRKRGVKRYIWDTKRRMVLLKYVKRVINSKNTEVEYRKDKQKFWALIKIIQGRKIKVILRKIGKGKLHFFSIFELKN